MIDLSSAVSEEMKNSLLLFYYYRRYGLFILHWWAAVIGCDISEKRSGIAYTGKEAFLDALQTFDKKPPKRLNSHSFETQLLKHTRPRCRKMYNSHSVAVDLRRVAQWFAVGGTYYDQAANVRSIGGDIVRAYSPNQRRHMIGDLNLKTVAEYTSAERMLIEVIQPHNLFQNLAARRESINGLSLPLDRATVAECRPEELKAMVVARGGNITDKDGRTLTKEQLQRMARVYLSSEKENSKHIVYFKWDRISNGIFADIDTSEHQSVPQIINQLLRCTEFEPSLHKFFVDLSQLVTWDSFIDNFATIAMEAPEFKERFIYEPFLRVGESETQKTIRAGLMKVLKADSILYHGVASEDSGSIYIVLKQWASQISKRREDSQPDCLW